MAISMAGLPAFLLYFVVGVALIAVFAVIYLRLTAHDEIALIRAATCRPRSPSGGNLAGFALPLEKAISQAGSIADLHALGGRRDADPVRAYGLARS